MIILDEQLLGRNLDTNISKWYPGAVRYIIDLRPDTIIKDEAIPNLLSKQNRPTFLTINVTDFWRKVEINHRFCVICFPLSDAGVREIPSLLRKVLSHSQFKTKTARMGKVIRVTEESINYYSFDDSTIQIL